jgi:glycosyltransferase involved in cell wall biosynthesis
MLGWVPKDELTGWIERARCLLFPSLWYEGYPLVVANALRAGLPVIVSRSSVAASSISDGVDGLHVAAGDIPAWIDAINRLKSDDLAGRLGQAAFHAGRQLLGYGAYMARLIEIYDAALSRKHLEAQRNRSIVQ